MDHRISAAQPFPVVESSW